MRNGGGPACLRLRVAMNDQELAAVNQNTLINDTQFATRLNAWVDKHYRDELGEDDGAGPAASLNLVLRLMSLHKSLKLVRFTHSNRRNNLYLRTYSALKLPSK